MGTHLNAFVILLDKNTKRDPARKNSGKKEVRLELEVKIKLANMNTNGYLHWMKMIKKMKESLVQLQPECTLNRYLTEAEAEEDDDVWEEDNDENQETIEPCLVLKDPRNIIAKEVLDRMRAQQQKIVMKF